VQPKAQIELVGLGVLQRTKMNLPRKAPVVFSIAA
jgi:hypothetical protein